LNEMSSDMMVICKEDDSSFEGTNSDKAFFIDECSMDDPWHEFGKWFQRRYCRAPSMLEQLAGGMSHHEHNYIELTKYDALAIDTALTELNRHERLDAEKFREYITSHIGKHISTENW